ncbi:MAG: PAS domain S-box protein [FCB group bacterium]|nr:PAS domain S-box protein [FCB group bacterium]
MNKQTEHSATKLLLSSIIESPENIVIFALDRDYCYTAFNRNHKQTMKTIWGVDIEIGMNMLTVIKNPGDRKKARRNFDRALAGEQFTLIEAYGEPPNRFYYENIYSPVYDDSGRITGLSLFLTDITKRKKNDEELATLRKQLEDLVRQRTGELEAAKNELEKDVAKRAAAEQQLTQTLEELKRHKSRLQTIIDAEPECVKVLDLDGNLVNINPAGLEMIEADSLDQVWGLPILNLIAPEHRALVQSMHDRVLAGHREILVFKLIGLRGTQRWMETHSVPLYGANKKITGLLSITRDITTQKQARDALYRRDAILDAISTTANLLLKTPSWTEVAQDVLDRFGRATGVSRVYIFKNHVDSDGISLTSQQFEWVAEGITPQINEPALQNIPWIASGMDRWLKTMQKNKPICGLVKHFPDSERAILEPQDIQSVLALPIFVDQDLWGFIGFDDCIAEREWSEQEISALQTAASALGFSIKRKQVEKSLTASEEKFRTLFENSRDAIYLSSADGTLIDFNHSMEDMLGFSPTELRSISIENLYADKNDRRLFQQIIESRGYVKDYELTLRKKDGTLIDCLITSSVYRNTAGHIIGYQGIIRDVTDQKRMTKAWITLRHLAKRLNEVWEISEIGPIVAEEAQNLFHYDAFSLDLVDEDLGILAGIYNEDTLEDGLAPVPVPSNSRPLAGMKDNIILQGKPRVINRKRIPKKPTTVMFGSNRLSRSLLYAPIFLKEKVIGVLSVQSYTVNKYTTEDIALLETFSDHASAALVRARQQETLKEALENARQGERIKTLFLANMSHEIRTPLNSILGFTEIIEGLARDKLGTDEQQFFDIVRISGKRLLHTVHEILDMSQIEAGTYRLRIETVDLCQLMDDLVQEISIEARNKGLKLEFKADTKTATIRADRHGISIAVGNILENAIKYTETGNIVLSVKSKSDHYILTVRDTGIGMSPDYVKRLFDTFTQESEGFTKDFQGIGLGMAIAKHHLEMNHVSVQVESTKGIGTTFTLLFRDII